MLSMNLGGIVSILMDKQGLFMPLWLGVALSVVAAIWLQLELVEPDRELHHETDEKKAPAGAEPAAAPGADEEEGAAPKTLNKKVLWIIVAGSVIDNIGSSGPLFGVYPVMWDTFLMDPWEAYAKDVDACMGPSLNCSACLAYDAQAEAYFCDLPKQPNPPMSFNSYKWVSTLFGLGILPTLVISGPVYAKLGFGGGCVLGNLLTAVHCIILLYMGKLGATATNYGLFVFAVYFGFPFTYLSQFTTQPMLDEITPEDMRGFINGLNNFAMSIAMSLAPFLLGLVGDAKGNDFLMWLCAAISVAAAAANAPLCVMEPIASIPKVPTPHNAAALCGEDKDMVARALRNEWVPAAELDKINEARMMKGEPFLRLHYGKYSDDKDNLPMLREMAKSDFTCVLAQRARATNHSLCSLSLSLSSSLSLCVCVCVCVCRGYEAEAPSLSHSHQATSAARQASGSLSSRTRTRARRWSR